MSDDLRALAQRMIAEPPTDERTISWCVRSLEDEIERRGLWAEYTGALLSILLDETDYDIIEGDPDRNLRDSWACVRATPEQRARAFLEAVGDA